MITVYGSVKCVYCDEAKRLLDRVGRVYQYIDVHEDTGAAELFRANGWRTVPQIFDGDHHIGGYQELTAYLR